MRKAIVLVLSMLSFNVYSAGKNPPPKMFSDMQPKGFSYCISYSDVNNSNKFLELYINPANATEIMLHGAVFDNGDKINKMRRIRLGELEISCIDKDGNACRLPVASDQSSWKFEHPDLVLMLLNNSDLNMVVANDSDEYVFKLESKQINELLASRSSLAK